MKYELNNNFKALSNNELENIEGGIGVGVAIGVGAALIGVPFTLGAFSGYFKEYALIKKGRK